MAERRPIADQSTFAHFLSGGGALGAVMRNSDWSATPLGEPETWPQSLRSAVSIMLNSRYPIALYWGPRLALLYNDAWSPIPGGKHPWALGRPAHEVWPEIWETIGPLFDKVIATGEGVWQEDELLPMLRHGYLEECYFNFTFSPIRGEDGSIGGIFNAVVETTERVLSERRLRTLGRMGERPQSSLSVEAACAWATNILRENRADAPFALVYLREGDAAGLVASAPLEAGSAAVPERLPVRIDGDSLWPLGAAEEAGKAIVIPVPEGHDLVGDFWGEAITEVVVAPVVVAGDTRPSAFLVAGANPRRRVNASYRSFFELAAGHIGNALATARAYDEERRRAQALADIDRAKTTFFSNISHEFRTPLTLMLGPLEAALAAAASPEQRERLDLANRNALRLLRLVNALLDFSRMEAGREKATFQPTDLASFTADLASSFRSATDKAGLELVVNTPALSAPAHVDRDMWEKIVLNLVSNAFKFTHRGEITVALREENGAAVLTISDTGVGIPAAELPKIFDRFHRVEGAKGRSFEGSGIGLALVHDLVKLHSGAISVDSEEGRGTTFTVSVPLKAFERGADGINGIAARSEAYAPATRAQAFVEEALRWLPKSSQSNAPADSDVARELPVDTRVTADEPVVRDSIVLADDNADLRDYIARLLAESGYEVETAPDGEAALAKLKSRRPDLLITDVMMPRLDGFGLLRAVRGEEGLRDLPVIMLSARAGEEAKLEGLHAEADDYLTKPFSARELLARVSANIKLSRLRREAADAMRENEKRLQELNATLNHRVAKALAEKRLLADIVAATDASVQAVDRDFRFLAINQTAQSDFERVFGVSPKAGDLVIDILAHLPQEREEARRVWGRALTGEPFSETSWWGSDAKERRAYEARFNPLLDAEGRRIGAFVFGRDVTERVREQERLAAAEEQLRQAQKMEAMGQLTGGVAHDFNNLLTPIVGALDMLQRKGLGGEREQRLIAGAAQSAERAKVLVQRLLAFARRQPLQPTAVNITKLVDGMADLVASTTGPQIRVVVDAPNDLPAAKADPNQIEMALLNLAVNARDAMPDGGTLRISASSEVVRANAAADLAPGRYVRLSVADTGVGMDEATLARATEPFFSTKGIGKGTGLGLSMAHGLASQLGGALTIQSRRGMGTNVELWLPVAIAPEELKGDSPKIAPPPVMRETVLLVDDEDLVRASTAAMLTELGYEVTETDSAEQALRLMREGLRPNLLVTDHLMPGMSGVDLARIVRSQKPDTKILVVSGYAEAEGVAPDLPRLAKPFRSEDLAASLADLRSGRW